MFALIVIALITLGSAAVAMSLRNLIHSALLLVATWAGVAVYYLWAGAEFVAFAQLLVYVGAVSMIVLFAVLLTRPSRVDAALESASLIRALLALVVGGAVLGVLFGAVLGSNVGGMAPPVMPNAPAAGTVTVKQLGTQLMNAHTAALLVLGLLLTVALLGAVVLAAPDTPAPEDET